MPVMAVEGESVVAETMKTVRLKRRSASAKAGTQHRTVAAAQTTTRARSAPPLAQAEAAKKRSATLPHASRRRRQVQLPGLQLLGTVARERDNTRGGYEALRRLCDAAEEEERRAVAQRRCDLLYAESKERRERAVARRAAQAQRTAEAERTSCTFVPALTIAASHDTADSAIDNFLQRCKAWQERTAAKLEERSRALDEEATRSELLASRRDGAQGGRSARSFLARCREDDTSLAEPLAAPLSYRPAVTDEEGYYNDSHVPVTHEMEQQAWAYLQQLTRRSQAMHALATTTDDKDNGGGEAGGTLAVEQDSGISLEDTGARKVNDTPRRPRRSVAAFLHDVEADLRRRAEKAAMRAAQEAAEQAERCVYEPITGRPLFKPNALPTMTKDGEHIPFDRLSQVEQTQLLTTLRRQHADPALLRWLEVRMRTRHEEDKDDTPRTDDAGLKESHRRALQRLLEHNAESAARRQATLERLRAEAASAAPFQPRITAKSAALARRRTAGVKIYDRPLPHRSSSRVSTANNNNTTSTVYSIHNNAGGKVSSVCSEHNGSVASMTRPHLVRSSDTHMADMLRRNEAWLQARAQRRRRAYAERMAQELQECPFTPQRAALHEVVKTGDGVLVAQPSGQDGAVTPGRLERHASQYAAPDEGEEREAGGARTPGTRATARTVDRLAMAADARLQHELQQLQARAASRAAQMHWQRAGTKEMLRGSSSTTPLHTFREFTLRSAPRLASRSASHRVRRQSHLRTLSRSFDAHDEDDDSLYASPITPLYDDDEAKSHDDRSPSVRRRIHDDDYGRGRDDYEYNDEREDAAGDDWSELDAQTDAILQRLAYTPSLH